MNESTSHCVSASVGQQLPTVLTPHNPIRVPPCPLLSSPPSLPTKSVGNQQAHLDMGALTQASTVRTVSKRCRTRVLYDPRQHFCSVTAEFFNIIDIKLWTKKPRTEATALAILDNREGMCRGGESLVPTRANHQGSRENRSRP